jgi:hypothetical protein
MNSLKAFIPVLSDMLRLRPDAVYERQRALVRAGLLENTEGRGPGSGVRLTPESVAMLLIAVMATDNLSETETMARTLGKARRSDGSKSAALGGAKTFYAAVINALSDDGVAEEILFVRVHRTNLSAEFFLKRGGITEFKSSKESSIADFAGMIVLSQIMGGTGGIGVLADIRAFLRKNENAAPKTTSKKRTTARKHRIGSSK